MRRTLLSSFSVCSFLLAQSQTFTTEVGVNYMLQPNSSHDISSYGITYSPRLNFWEKGNSSWSLGFPLSFGWSDLKSPHFAAVDLPAEVAYNFGAGSAKDNNKKFGFFVGAGYALHVTVVHYYPPQSFPTIILPTSWPYPLTNLYYGPAAHVNAPKSTFGPTLDAGIRLATGHKGRIVEFRMYYMKVLEVPDMLQKRYFYDNMFKFQNTIVLGAGCFISF